MAIGIYFRGTYSCGGTLMICGLFDILLPKQVPKQKKNWPDTEKTGNMRLSCIKLYCSKKFGILC